MAAKDKDYIIPEDMVQEWANSHTPEPGSKAFMVYCPVCHEPVIYINGAGKGIQSVCPGCGASILTDVDADGICHSSFMPAEQYAAYLRQREKNSKKQQ